MKILIISQYFYPENFKINDVALTLKEKGYEVEVLTGIPNYPLGNFYDGFKFLSKNDTWIDNETIVNATVTSNGLSAEDLSDYTSFYSGLEPFNINMSSTSINIVNTVLNNSGYSLYNYIQI